MMLIGMDVSLYKTAQLNPITREAYTGVMPTMDLHDDNDDDDYYYYYFMGVWLCLMDRSNFA